MKASTKLTVAPAFHVPSPFYNQGEQDPDKYNYGRIEHDLLHHVTAAVHAIGTAGSRTLIEEHVRCARSLLDALDEIAAMFPESAP